MNDTILVTGGTGGLGRPTVSHLRAAGGDIRVLSRKPGDGRVVANLQTGDGVTDALEGVHTVLHLATNRWNDAKQTGQLIAAAQRAGAGHLIYISIVGIEDIPYRYYASKLECERLIEDSGIPFTILRATQFHDFVASFFTAQRRLPVLFVPDLPVQPIATDEVAVRLSELTRSAPAGRVPDIGGPEHASVRSLAEQWQTAHGTRKRTPHLAIGGKTVAAFRAGHHMTPLPGYGTETFAEYAARHAASGA